jgi:hypothetical protein
VPNATIQLGFGVPGEQAPWPSALGIVTNNSSTTIIISSFNFTANVPQDVGGPTVALEATGESSSPAGPFANNGGTSLPMQLAPGQSEAFQGGVWPNSFASATSQVIWSWTDVSAYSTCPSAPLEPTYR